MRHQITTPVGSSGWCTLTEIHHKSGGIICAPGGCVVTIWDMYRQGRWMCGQGWTGRQTGIIIGR